MRPAVSDSSVGKDKPRTLHDHAHARRRRIRITLHVIDRQDDIPEPKEAAKLLVGLVTPTIDTPENRPERTDVAHTNPSP
jgi:hypothetical protein